MTTPPLGRAKPNARNASPLKLAERDVTRTCREYLQLRGWRPIRINAGPFGSNGMPDYVFLHYAKRLILWIEFKAPNGRLGPKQVEWIEGERARGATVLIVRDYDDFCLWYERTYGVEGQQRLEGLHA